MGHEIYNFVDPSFDITTFVFTSLILLKNVRNVKSKYLFMFVCILWGLVSDIVLTSDNVKETGKIKIQLKTTGRWDGYL